MLVALSGLPGTGKSTLAGRLAAALGGVVLSKDSVRAALFPAPALNYSRAQDDLAMSAVYAAAAHLLRTRPELPVLLDGRTYSQPYQVADLTAFAAAVGETPFVIECVCSDATARGRLERDLAAGEHPAKNRTFALYLERKAAAQPLTVPRLVLDTGELSAEECVRRCLRHLGRG